MRRGHRRATLPDLGTGCGSPGGSGAAAVLAGRAGRARPGTAVPAGHGRRSWRRGMTAVTMAGVTAAAAACAGHGGPAGTAGAGGPEKRDLVVAVPAEANAGLYIAQARGLFTKVGLHVTVKPVVSAGAVIPAMRHGSVDVAGGGYVSYIAADAAGIAKMRILAAGFALGPHVNEIIALPRAHIQSPAELRGKTIAINQLGSVGNGLTYRALAPYGITPGQVHLVAMPFPAMPAALAAGKIDAAYETEPFVTEAVKMYGALAVADMDSG